MIDNGVRELLVVVVDENTIPSIEEAIGVEPNRWYEWEEKIDVVFYVQQTQMEEIDEILRNHPDVQSFAFDDYIG